MHVWCGGGGSGDGGRRMGRMRRNALGSRQRQGPQRGECSGTGDNGAAPARAQRRRRWRDNNSGGEQVLTHARSLAGGGVGRRVEDRVVGMVVWLVLFWREWDIGVPICVVCARRNDLLPPCTQYAAIIMPVGVWCVALESCVRGVRARGAEWRLWLAARSPKPKTAQSNPARKKKVRTVSEFEEKREN
jgi:hypothetical protein